MSFTASKRITCFSIDTILFLFQYRQGSIYIYCLLKVVHLRSEMVYVYPKSVYLHPKEVCLYPKVVY